MVLVAPAALEWPTLFGLRAWASLGCSGLEANANKGTVDCGEDAQQDQQPGREFFS
jgi:hypothetical protein